MERKFQEDKYREIVDAVFSRFADWQRGTTIPWQEIELAMGRGRYDEGGRCIINRFRRRLRDEREIATWAKTSVGIRLLTHEETAREIPLLRQRKAYRQVNKALKEIATVDQGALPDRLRLALVMQQQAMRQHRLELGRSKRQAARVGRRSPTHPVRRLAAVG